MKDPVKRTKDKWQSGRKYFAAHRSNKGFGLHYIKNSQDSILKKRNSPVRKWTKDIHRHFMQEDIQMTNKHARCSASLITTKCRMKTTGDVTAQISEWLKWRIRPNADEDVEKLHHSSIARGNVNGTATWEMAL